MVGKEEARIGSSFVIGINIKFSLYRIRMYC